MSVFWRSVGWQTRAALLVLLVLAPIALVFPAKKVVEPLLEPMKLEMPLKPYVLPPAVAVLLAVAAT